MVGGAALQGGAVRPTEDAALLDLVQAEGEPHAQVVLVAVGRVREAAGTLADERQRVGAGGFDRVGTAGLVGSG